MEVKKTGLVWPVWAQNMYSESALNAWLSSSRMDNSDIYAIL